MQRASPLLNKSVLEATEGFLWRQLQAINAGQIACVQVRVQGNKIVVAPQYHPVFVVRARATDRAARARFRRCALWVLAPPHSDLKFGVIAHTAVAKHIRSEHGAAGILPKHGSRGVSHYRYTVLQRKHGEESLPRHHHLLLVRDSQTGLWLRRNK